MKKNIFNVGIVGFGHIGKLHLETISQMEEIQVIAVVDSDLLSHSSQTIPLFSSIKDCHDSFPEIDLYVIATPNGCHYEQAKEILNLHKNVLVEKPITLYKHQAEELVALASANNVRIFSSMQLRFSPVISYLKKLYSNDSLGKLYLVNVECFWNRNAAYYEKSSWHGTREIDGGVLFTQFSHFIDILHYLLGNIELTSSQTDNYSHQDCSEFPDSGILQFKSGKTLGSMVYTISTYEKNFESSITLIGEKGTIKIGGQYMNQLLYHNVQGINPPEIECNTNKFHKNLYEDLLNSIKNNTPSITDAENAIEVIGFTESIIK